MRVAYASVQERDVDWDFEERVCTVIGNARARGNFLTDFRIELESQMALSVLRGGGATFYYEYRSRIKMLDVEEALLISEPKTQFSVPIKVTHYPEYLEEREKIGYELAESRMLSRMNE